MTALRIARLEDLQATVGIDLGPGPWLLVDQARLSVFERATAAPCASAGRDQLTESGADLVPGLLMLGLTSSLAEDLYHLRLGSARLNYGLDRVRYPAPARVGSRVRLRCRIADVEQHPAGVLVPFDFAVEVEGSQAPACEARKRSLVLL